MKPTRRVLLSGLLTLAVTSRIVPAATGITPLEAAAERVRAARLATLTAPGGGSVVALLNAVQGFRDLGLSPPDVHHCCRLAFRMAKHDFQLRHQTGIAA